VKSLSADAREMLSAIKGATPLEQLDSVWKELQNHVDHVLDREMNRSAKGATGWGFKQLIERKQGLFRMHMMGKRVNFAARTVITPDPNIAIDEIGLPEVFAKKLTYKVPVTPWNLKALQEMVRNGPDVHPGACFVENSDDGRRVAVSPDSETQRNALAKTLLAPGDSSQGDLATSGTKYVYRHLQNGDAMLLNRQPSLHKPSIMSHRARVLKGEKVMRLHYAICKSYNADFDGDEMNAHFPQNEIARSEAYNIVNVCHQYLVPKDGSPLQGLIQDHVIAAVKMTMRGRFFTRADYQQLVYQALSDQVTKIKTVPPTILKPEMLWSGKQIVTTIILNLVPEGKVAPTLISSAKIKPGEWERQPPRQWRAGGSPFPKNSVKMTDSEVIFRQGDMVSGVLDKNQFGATAYSLTHAFFELYGGKYSGKLLSALSKIFTNFLHTEGFTLGVRDIVVTDAANQKRKQVMEETAQVGKSCAAKCFGIADPNDVTVEELNEKLADAHREGIRVPQRRAEVDRAFKEKLNPATNNMNTACIPKGLVKTFPENNLQLMVQSGAKGSTVNTMQISCLLGQIELEGKRPPLMISGKSLPSFRAYDTRPIAGGFIAHRFMTGIKPQEFFFHCMAGREGLIDTAVKTSRSGYLQRCLIKLLEGLVVNYDQTVRDSDGSVVQFQYGEDAMDVCKSQYLKPKTLDFLKDNMGSLTGEGAIQRAKTYSQPRSKEVSSRKKAVKKWQSKYSNKDEKGAKRRSSGFLKFCESQGKVGAQNSSLLVQNWRNLDDGERRKFHKKAAARCPDPVISDYRGDANFSSVSEVMDSMIETYFQGRSWDGQQDVRERFEDTLRLKVMQAQVEPGEPVGVLAAQSVGEPSTQMTLNTFHFAGRGEMNVTLGIPRLREILMVASANIKTPTLSLPFLKGVSQKDKDNVRIQMNKTTLADVLETVTVTERLKIRGGRAKIVKMRFEFLPKKVYKQDFKVTPSELLNYFETRFIQKVFIPVLSAVIKDKKVALETSTEKTPKAGTAGSEANEDDEASDKRQEKFEKKGEGEGHVSSDEEDLADDADATDARKRARQADEDYEEGLSDEEMDLVKNIAKEFDDDQILDGEQSGLTTRTPSPTLATNGEADDGFDEDWEEFRSSSAELPEQVVEESNEEIMNRDPEARKRKNFVMNLLQGKCGFAQIHDYSYDVRKQKWCELTLSLSASRKSVDLSNVLKKAAEKAVIYEIKNIKRGIIGKDDRGEDCLTTEGVNIDAMFQHESVLDLNKLYCNNIHEMARYYGIEAAAKAIVREICTVFKPYGIDVDKRHLTLIADYMTFDGTYKPFNRIGIENNPSPLQQMTFETAIGFLRSATLGGKCDTLDSPSSRLVVGRPCHGGTGTFDVGSNLFKMGVTVTHSQTNTQSKPLNVIEEIKEA